MTNQILKVAALEPPKELTAVERAFVEEMLAEDIVRHGMQSSMRKNFGWLMLASKDPFDV